MFCADMLVYGLLGPKSCAILCNSEDWSPRDSKCLFSDGGFPK